MDESIPYSPFRWLILLTAVLGCIAMQAVNLSISPILPQIAKDLAVDMGAATNLLTAFVFSGCLVFLFVGGMVCDRYGVIPPLFLGLLFATVPAALMPWIGKTYTAVFWARIFEGFSAGFIVSAMGPIIAIWFPLRQKGLASGIMGASVSVGSALGLIAGPALFLAKGSWQVMSAWLSSIGWLGLAFAFVLFIIPRPQPPLPPAPEGTLSHRSDFKKALLFPVTWLGVLLFFMAAWVLQGLYGLTPAFLAADRPMGAGFGPMVSGQLMLVMMAAGIVGPLVCGLLTDRAFRGDPKPAMFIGFTLSFVFVYLLQLPLVYTTVPLLVSALLLAGLGCQILYPAVFVYIAKAYVPHIVGKMTGLWTGLATMGGVFGLFMGGWAVNKFENYNAAITLIALAGLAGLILAFILPKSKA